MDSPLLALSVPCLASNQDDSSTLFSQISRFANNRTSRSRHARNALYRHTRFLSSLPEDAKAYHTENRNAEGLPRAFSICFTDPEVAEDHPSLKKLNNKTIIFGRYSSNNGGVLLNNRRIEPDETTFCAPTKSVSFTTNFTPEKGVERNDIGAYFTFEASQPSGIVAVGTRAFNVTLDPKKVWFNVNVSANAGAYYSAGEKTLKWNSESDEWRTAAWENESMTFGYNLKNIGDELQEQWVPELSFIDNVAKPAKEFDLPASSDTYPRDYTSTLSPATEKGSIMTTNITIEPPSPPPERKNNKIKSLFPVLWEIQMSPFGDQFSGAYRDSAGHVYAVSGMVQEDDDESLLSMLSVPRKELPVQDLYACSPRSEESINVEEPEGMTLDAAASAVHPEQDGIVAMSSLTGLEEKFGTTTWTAQGAPPLKVSELLNLNPMVSDPKDPSGYRDTVATEAMDDFHQLIIYFMDPDLRSTFVQATAPIMTPSVLSVANDDVALNNNENKIFYQKLQVPFIVSMLSQGTLSQASQCNGARANAKLKEIPKNDPVYKRHSAKLYRARYLDRFPAIKRFLKDQKEDPHLARMTKFADKMKATLEEKSRGLKDSNPRYDEQLAGAKKDIDNVIDWAKERSLYWAVELLYYIQRSSLPNWYGQYTSGGASQTLSMTQKQLNALFGLLEDNAINTKPNARNFMQAFNEDVRLFQMTAIVPSLIDMDGNAQEFDNLFVQCLDEYIKNFKASPDEYHIQAIQAAQKLYADKELRRKFWQPLCAVSRVGQAAGSWNMITSKWELAVNNAQWFKNLQHGSRLLSCFQAMSAATLIIVGFLPGMRDKWTKEQQRQWALAIGGLCGMLVIKIAQGVVRFIYLFHDIAGFGNSLKCILGFESVVDKIPQAADRFQGSFAKFFTRTSKQTLELAEQEAFFQSELIGEKEFSNFTTIERLLGRNMGEVIGTVCGLALAVVSIVLTAIDLANQHEGLLIAMDIIMIISSVIQILAVAAGWIIVLGAASAGSVWAALASYSVVSLCAVWGGPLAIVFAIIGMIIFMVWYFTQDHRDPTEKFLDDWAGPAGLRMRGEKQAPEYFGVVPASASNPSLVGLSFRGPLVSLKTYQVFPKEGTSPILYPSSPIHYIHETLKIDAGSQKYLALDADMLRMVDDIDFSLNTVWSLETNCDGKSFIYTAAVKKSPVDEDGIASVSRRLWYLATSDDNSRVQLREMPTKADEGKRRTVMEHALWTVDILEPPTVDAPDVRDVKGNITQQGHVMSALVNISQGGAQLGRWVDRRTLKIDDGIAIASKDKSTSGNPSYPDRMFCAGWAISMAPIGPSEFSYAHEQWRLVDSDTDRRNVPRFLISEASSGGLKWDIQPALDPECFELVKLADSDEGIIRQVTAKKPRLMAPTSYTVSCSLLVNGMAKGTRTTVVTIEVVKDIAEE